ncbi:DUF4411 family protein [Candidatus Poriferisocius sp.]|uniref:DUF4411 family protein n=1 Tax=Candidatus Poriferisocius sp. TaxID=3101276 RepID=UPI003B01C634
MAYLLDTDVFIRAKNDHYGLDFCPAFWDWLKITNAAGVVYSVDAVYKELMTGKDNLSDWVEAHKRLFIITSSRELLGVRSVNQWAQKSQNYDMAAKNKFASKADSFLVGHALAGGHTVVTHERPGQSRKKIKIPDAAMAHKISGAYICD